MTTINEALNRAADIIEVRGWTTAYDAPAAYDCWFPDPDGTDAVCAEGAIRLATCPSSRREGEVTAALGHYLLDLYPDMVRSKVHGGVIVFSWNDRPGMDATQVIAALRAAAAVEAAREDTAKRVTA